jgi:DNA-binding Lrp family transcriptional regulator
MADGSGDWRSAIDPVAEGLLDAFQSGVPIEPRPFDAVADALGAPPGVVVDRVADLHDRGLIRRFGPVLNPPVIGSSTLAAIRAADDDAAAAINRHPQVNHNYRRDHAWALWFVVTAGSRDRRDAVLDAIAADTGAEPLVLPMLTDYYVDLEFPVVNDDGVATAGDRADVTRMEECAADLSRTERAVVRAVQGGLPVEREPYVAVAERLQRDDGPAVDRTAVIGALRGLRDRGCVKRIGCVVNHHRVGFDSNCMVVWDVPDGERDAAGVDAGGHPNVTLCYHRPRRPERDWPYNLFTMVHGRDPDAVDATLDALAAGPLPYPHERLRTTATLKQTGARYEALVDAADPGDEAPANAPVEGADRSADTVDGTGGATTD